MNRPTAEGFVRVHRRVGSVLLGVALLGFSCAGSGAGPSPPNGGGADVLSLRLEGCPASLPIGESVPCRAMASLRTGATVNVSDRSLWTSSDENVLRISQAGLATARSHGRASVAATLQGRTGSADIAVTGPQEDWIRVGSTAAQGTFRPGTDATIGLGGFYSLVSATSATVSVTVSNGNTTIGVAELPITRGGDAYFLLVSFQVPANASEVCPAARLRVGSTVLIAPIDRSTYCVPVRP